jgi:hypothetical protein
MPSGWSEPVSCSVSDNGCETAFLETCRWKRTGPVSNYPQVHLLSISLSIYLPTTSPSASNPPHAWRRTTTPTHPNAQAGTARRHPATGPPLVPELYPLKVLRWRVRRANWMREERSCQHATVPRCCSGAARHPDIIRPPEADNPGSGPSVWFLMRQFGLTSRVSGCKKKRYLTARDPCNIIRYLGQAACP